MNVSGNEPLRGVGFNGQSQTGGVQENENQESLIFNYGDTSSDGYNEEEYLKLQEEYSAKEKELITAATKGEDKSGIKQLGENLANLGNKIREMLSKKNSAPRDKNLKGVKELGEGHYKADGKNRAENSLDASVLDTSAKTLPKSEQESVLKQAGLDIDSLSANESQDGTVSFSKDNKHYRVVNHGGDVKIIHTTIDGDNAATVVYKVDKSDTSNSGTNKSGNVDIDKLAQDVANGEKIFMYRDENGKLGPNPKFKDMDSATLSKIINKANTLEAKQTESKESERTREPEKSQERERTSSSEYEDNSRTEEKLADISAKIDIQNRKISEIQDEIDDLKDTKPSRADRDEWTEWAQEKNELEKEKKEAQKELAELKRKIKNAKSESRTYDDDDRVSSRRSSRSTRTEKKKSGLEKLTDEMNEATKLLKGTNNLLNEFHKITHNGKGRSGGSGNFSWW